MTNNNSMFSFYAYYFYCVTYFIIFCINNKFIDNYIERFKLSFHDLTQIQYYNLCGVICAAVLLLIINDLVKIKNLIIIGVIIYLFSAFMIIYNFDNQTAHLIYFASYAFSSSIIGLIILSKLLTKDNIYVPIKIFVLSLSAAGSYLFIKQYYLIILNIINYDFIRLLGCEMLMFIKLFISEIILKKISSSTGISEPIQSYEGDFLLVVKNSKVEILSTCGIFFCLIIYFDIFLLKSNENILYKVFIQNKYLIIAIIFATVFASIMLYKKYNIFTLNGYFLIFILILKF